MITELNERSREVFRLIVDAYVETGEPVGSRAIARRLGAKLSPATVRNVMADLEDSGLLFAPHTSAGRLPTDAGLRLFVDGLLEIGNLSAEERESIKGQCAGSSNSLDGLLEEATAALSGLTGCASLVLAPKTESPLKHIEFVNLSPGRSLVVLVTESGIVENRIADVPPDMPPSGLIEASNYLDSRLTGRTFGEARDAITNEIAHHTAELDDLTARVVEAGLATWAGGQGPSALIVRGQGKLLTDVTAVEDLERIRKLFDALEAEQDILRMLEMAEGAEGVRIYIGSENQLFEMSGSSMVVAPYTNSHADIVGAIGIIGPTRLNYARIIPMVDYTAKVIGRLVG
ncbi:MAG: heat-inducible transcriptional repressor HrcA [Rhodospirillaceae bacterium]|nr:heat-inducible transcriptional repressor HrcA [Rhodospirillaceae bacterium]